MLFDTGDKLVFIGDSISDCGRARPVGEGLGLSLGNGFIADVAALLGSAHPAERLRVVNMGISGNRIRDLKARWDDDVLALQPDWVCVLIGINDVWRQFDSPLQPEEHVLPDEYESTYIELIERTLPHVKGMVLMTPYYIEPNPQDAMRARMDAYGAIVKRVAERFGLPCIDMQAAWSPLFAHMYPGNIAWDRVHPNHLGAVHLARAFLKATGYEM
ncbi:MAG: SGNH/GDSL hydrolase family protein [Oscillospiraceae bacterium]|jgi:lysophospholipase L1-like esterase|nr:SGNH/GDSL hydrolase family protein [Oscillospiraceae bacterium]